MADEPMPVRLSHLLRECAVGAVVRGPDYLLTVKDTRLWPRGGDRDLRHVEQVRHVLGIDKVLRSPPTARIEDGGAVQGASIPAMRFPGWARCPRCGLLHHRPWKRAHTAGPESRSRSRRGTWICEAREHGKDCGGRLEQVPWVLAHRDGYLADVPWHGVAHAASRRAGERACRPDWRSPYLEVAPRGRSHEVRCRRCRARGELPPRFPYGEGTWQQPWFREPPPEPPGEPAWVIPINDVRVHTAVTANALVIPPESRIRRGTVVDRLYGSSEKQRRLRDARPGLPRRAALTVVAQEFDCSAAEVEEALKQIDEGYPFVDPTGFARDAWHAEYRALVEEIADLREDEDFVTRHLGRGWDALVQRLPSAPRRIAAVVDRLVAVDRLKEIMVLKGFRRLVAGEALTPPDLTGESDWLPALDLYGEGVFFTLDEAGLSRWEADEGVQARARVAAARLAGGAVKLPVQPQVSPRFLLLHTLAHLLVRELETAAGYPAASLKERIYSHAGDGSDGPPMAGVLVYVAVPDTEGSLGGLTRQAEPHRFLRLLTAAVEAAGWCSMDPVCGEQEGHGPGLLNRAACHACALVPEPSCAYGNVLLDRAFVAGDAEGRCPSLFGARPQAGGGV